ncbi:MAG: sporulation protein YunB [Syntrophomonadaceae bacterium]|nr:sporulation protein YunB [Syntrophomonadaceae bacterium]
MYGRRRARRRVAVVILVVLVSFIIIVDINIRPALMDIARSRAQLEGVESINRAVNNRLVSEVEYRDLVYVHKDNRGRIVMVQPNTVKINQLTARTMLEVKDVLEDLNSSSFEIPLGQAFGFTTLAGYGPRIKVKIMTTGTVNVSVIDKFEGAGINQTRHLIYLQISSKMRIAIPFMDEDINVDTTLPIAETIIVGDVPEFYVGLDSSQQPLPLAISPRP